MRIVGDIGIRSFPFMLARMLRIIHERRIDLVYIPIPPNYTSLLGPVARYWCRVPFAIDYIDPWVYPPTDQERQSRKAMASHRLARLLEPIALQGIAGITGVAEGYFAGVLERHPHLRELPHAAIPYGGEPEDHAVVRSLGRRSPLLHRPELTNKQVLVYAGAILPRAHGTLRTLLQACRRWKESGDPNAERIHLLFVGTGQNPSDAHSGIVAPIAAACGAGHFVTEVANRQGYLDVLSTLDQAHGVMILGSSESFYTASKTFQALHSLRPILGMLHAKSSACEVLRGMPGVELVTFDESRPVERCEENVIEALRGIAKSRGEPVPRKLDALEAYSAREMTRKLAGFFDEVLARQRKRKK